MASFSVVSNIAAPNAQANLYATQHRPAEGADAPVERPPHQQVGRRRGGPGGGQRLSFGRRGPQPGHPQRERRPVDPADQGRRAQQHRHPARPPRRRWRRSRPPARPPTSPHRRCSSEFRTRSSSEIDREATVAGLDTQAGFSVFVSNDGTNGVVGGHRSRRSPRRSPRRSTRSTSTTSPPRRRRSRRLRRPSRRSAPSQGSVGTLENRLQFAISLAQSQKVNNKAAESRIRDANVAEESANMTRFNILTQSGIAALAAGEPDVGVGAVTAAVSA